MPKKIVGRVRVIATGRTQSQAKATARREADRAARQLKRKLR